VNYGPASKFYDLFSHKDDIAFYRDLARNNGRRVLELGVGTGRVAIELARSGISVLGIDNSKYMLAVAERKLERESVSVRELVTLRLGDMRRFRSKMRFPFMCMASQTFEHCLTEEDQKRCLKCAYSTLEEGGTLAFDVSQHRKSEPTGSWYIDSAKLSPQRKVVRTIFSKRDMETNVVTLNLFFDVFHKGEMKVRFHECGKAKITEREDIERKLKEAGFSLRHVYGNYDLSEYSTRSERMIFVATKPSTSSDFRAHAQYG